MMPDPLNDLTPEEDRAFAEQEAVAKRAARWAVTADAITHAHNSPLSDEQAAFMAQIRRTRTAGMLPDLHAIDLLIEIVEELIK